MKRKKTLSNLIIYFDIEHFSAHELGLIYWGTYPAGRTFFDNISATYFFSFRTYRYVDNAMSS